jgi:hypothetical protein
MPVSRATGDASRRSNLMSDAAKPLPTPLVLSHGADARQLSTVREVLDALTLAWPEEARGPRHRDAVETCLKVLDGHRSASDAVMALQAAAAEAGLRLDSAE